MLVETAEISERTRRLPSSARLRQLLASRAATGTSALLALLLIAAACGVAVWLGVPHAAVYGHDTFIMLDGGWRVLQGQRPHTDFYSAFGPVPYLIAAAGLRAAHSSVEGIAYATAAIGAVLGVWALMLVRVRVQAWLMLLYVAWVVLFWLAPFPLGEPFYMTGYAMQYNRLGYVLASLILVELFSRRAPAHGIDYAAISTGIAATLLLFLKVSFFVAAGVLIVASYLVTRKGTKHALFLLLGFGLTSAALMSYLDWNLPAMLGDWRLAAAARETRFLEGYDPFRSILRNMDALLLLAGVALLAVLQGQRARHAWGLAGAAAAADLLLAMTNTQRIGLPLTLIATLMLTHRRRTGHPVLSAAMVLVAIAAVMPVLSGTVNAWGMVARSNVFGEERQDAAVVDAPHLSALVFDDHNEPSTDPAIHNGSSYVNAVNDGLALLRKSTGSQDRIACLWFANPFSYALLREPPSGGSPFFGYGVNFTAEHAPAASRILGNADIAMQPKESIADINSRTLLAVTQSELRRAFRIVDQSENWILWRRQ